MATSTNLPVSAILKSSTDPDEPKKKSRDDWRKAKELEEARKAGTAPAAVDEEGKDINPHIPQYISSAPWYYNTKGPTLKHQRIQEESVKQFSGIDEWYNRGVDSTKVATKYRKGACENCGAMTHKKKDCLERPRKIGAKYSGAKIAPDEFMQPVLDRDYDGKRDRWAGYDPSQHRAVVEHYAKVDEAKRQLRAEKLKTAPEGEEQPEDEDDAKDNEDADDDKYVDEVDMPGTKVDSKQRITVRNLRIREDTAKYLRNLDPNSAYYDPKTRSMRDNPYADKAEMDADYAGENFVRYTGDTMDHAKTQLFAWEAHEKGVEVHPLGEPTKLEILRKQYDEKKDEFKKKGQLDILEKYGGEEHLSGPPKELLLAQTEYYAEYTRHGTIIKGQEKAIVRSKYEEDVFINNHTSVWGSYWYNGRWGYRCCHSFIKGSYCTGEAGRIASRMEGTHVKGPFIIPANLSTEEQESSSSSEPSSDDSSSSSSSSDEEERQKKKKPSKQKAKKEKPVKKKNKKKAELTEEEKLAEALRKEEEAQKEGERLQKIDDRKRSYNSMVEVSKPTDIEMEAYYMKKRRDEDPMAQFL
ncbi:pre-mRNA-splicing factor SLU7 [Cimex lectularius]|uniref:Pre-mRNA-splicing factor SLU7 n=1 Tax=Cimex lectularius TaxID=79782 RepID=A0A8I6R851_CIMLE|nr:pre-mRNA-splicing factor SLU7 [Cimex lectularius]